MRCFLGFDLCCVVGSLLERNCDMKSFVKLCVVCVLIISPLWSMGKKSAREVSILLVPATPNLVQLGRDLSDTGSVFMMSYAPEAAPNRPFLHIWDGNQWLPVSSEAFASGSFMKVPVQQVIVVGLENDRTAHLIETSLMWCPEVLNMSTYDVTALINQLGRIYDFSKAEWEWVAERYQLELQDLTSDLPQQSWYDRNHPSDVPRTPPPWKQKKSTGSVPPPSTSLTPVEPLPEPQVQE